MKITQLFLFLIVFFFLKAVEAKKEMYIVEDLPARSSKLKNWRDPLLLYQYAQLKKINTAGLLALNASASAMPSRKGLEKIQTQAVNISKHRAKDIYIIDLRQEPHGYLNGAAITLVGNYNWASRNKTISSALMAEKNWLHALSTETVIYNVLSPGQYKKHQWTAGKALPVKEIMSEKRAAIHQGLHYVRLMVTDHLPPGDVEVDTFVQLVKGLPSSAWLHLHCRGGKGRTTTFMTMLDMLYNSQKASFEDIIQRQAVLPPYHNLLETERKQSTFRPFYEQRAIFIRQFYQFSQAYAKDSTLVWSQWKLLNAHSKLKKTRHVNRP